MTDLERLLAGIDRDVPAPALRPARQVAQELREATRARRRGRRSAAGGMAALGLIALVVFAPRPDPPPPLPLSKLTELTRDTAQIARRLALLEPASRKTARQAQSGADHLDWLACRWDERSERALRAGSPDEARAGWQRVLDRLPNTRAAERARERIAELDSKETR